MDRLTDGAGRSLTPIAALLVLGVAAQPANAAQLQAVPDSQTVLEALRASQARFERLRRHHLPWARRSYGRNSEIIGRFRFWYDDEPDPPPQGEHERIGTERNRLLARLDSGATRLPGDPWIAGQRVRYLTEVRRYESALAAVRQCRAAPWWCLALGGFVQHESGNFAGADDLFRAAGLAMPDTLRCEWTDLSLILDGDARGRYRKLSCEERAAFEARLWWLADPLYIVPGNERRTEHHARRVYDRMLRGSASTFGMRWGRDNRELVLRFGWPVRWERERTSSASLRATDHIVGHQPSGALHFIPTLEVLHDVTVLRPDGWNLKPERPRARYAPPYADEFVPLAHQLATFRRGDSIVVVAAYEPPEVQDDSGRGKPYLGEALLALAPDEHTHPRTARARAGRPLVATAPIGAMLVSLETLSVQDSVAGRKRYWVDFAQRVPAGFALSDVLLVHRSDDLPQTLSEAIPAARPALAAARGETVALYWELYGHGPAAGPLDVALTVVKTDKSFLRKAGEFLGVVGARRDRVALRWLDTGASADPIASRSISLKLPEDDGLYTLSITATRVDGARAETVRRLHIREAADRP